MNVENGFKLNKLVNTKNVIQIVHGPSKQLHELVAICHYLRHQLKHVGLKEIQLPLNNHLQLQCEAKIEKRKRLLTITF